MRVALACALALLAGPALAHGGGPLDHMELAPFLGLGFTIGLAHALDADHVAAVAAMLDRGDRRGRMIARGAAWGLGHTAALFVICSTVLLLGLSISDRLAAALELAVGVTIVVLGVRVFLKLWRERIHIHVHAHGGTRHVHAHSHAGDTRAHRDSAHAHAHGAGALLPSLGVGVIHGAAGSAGLLVLTVVSAETTAHALAAFAVFGVGSMIGMTLLTAVASYPLAWIHRGSVWMRTTLGVAIGGLALLVGSGIAIESLSGLGWL